MKSKLEVHQNTHWDGIQMIALLLNSEMKHAHHKLKNGIQNALTLETVFGLLQENHFHQLKKAQIFLW